jgi:hypothetical protein
LIFLLILDRDAGLGGANLGAVSAICAKPRIDDIYGITSGDGILRTFRKTGVAHDAIVGDYISQIRSSPKITRNLSQ